MKIGEEKREVLMRHRSGTRKEVTFYIFFCPSNESCSSSKPPESGFKYDSGFNNPYYQLNFCLVNGDGDEFLEIHHAALEVNKQKGTHFAPISNTLSGPNNRERAVDAYQSYIVLRSRPISDVKDPEIHSFCNYNSVFSRSTLE